MPSDDPLAGLRALHLPPETNSIVADVGLAVAAGLIAALLAIFVLRLLAKPKRSLRDSALDAFAEARTLPPGERRAAQAAILRRVVRTVEGEDPARATGPAWSEALDRTFKTDLFTARGGKVFADGLYARPQTAGVDDPELDRELGGLLERLGR